MENGNSKNNATIWKILLLIAIVIIVVMGCKIYKMSEENKESDDETNKATVQIENSDSKNEVEVVGNSSINNTGEAEETSKDLELDKEYVCDEYGISFFYPSILDKNDTSLVKDSVETLYNKDDGITIVDHRDESIENAVEEYKNTILPDGTKMDHQIRDERKITTKNDVEGYEMISEDGTIFFVFESANRTFTIACMMSENEKLNTKILNTLKTK